LATLLLANIEAQATQILSGRPDETLSASVSRVEPTLIRVDGQRIRRVFGAEGDFTVTPDKEAGTAYLKPTTDKQVFSVFISDESGRTWKLLLSIVDGPSESIVIKGKRETSNNATGRDLARNQAIKRVVLALDSEVDGDLDARTSNEIVPLWKEAMFVLVKIVDGPLRGEKYMLTNTSDKPMVIDERELYRRGVVAISVEKPDLKPAETTAVYVVLENAE
jgi:conjugal transfer pilus assembly protein TraK